MRFLLDTDEDPALAPSQTESAKERGFRDDDVPADFGEVSDKENGDDWFNVGRFDVSGSFVVAPRFTLTAGYYNSNSRLDSREGYAADGFFVGLDYTHHD